MRELEQSFIQTFGELASFDTSSNGLRTQPSFDYNRNLATNLTQDSSDTPVTYLEIPSPGRGVARAQSPTQSVEEEALSEEEYEVSSSRKTELRNSIGGTVEPSNYSDSEQSDSKPKAKKRKTN